MVPAHGLDWSEWQQWAGRSCYSVFFSVETDNLAETRRERLETILRDKEHHPRFHGGYLGLINR